MENHFDLIRTKGRSASGSLRCSTTGAQIGADVIGKLISTVAKSLGKAADIEEEPNPLNMPLGLTHDPTGSAGGAPNGSSGEPKRSSRRLWWMALSALVALAAVSAAVLGILGVSRARSVTSDPSPANTMSMAHVFTPPTNGVISDPFVLPTPRLDYMYSSGEGGVGQLNMPLRTFRVMGKFLSLTDALPHPPSWVVPNSGLWAPDVRKIGGTYVMWYTGQYLYKTLSTGDHPKCIGVATSRSSAGPFVPTSEKPSICQVSLYGDIDPTTLVTRGGQEWLYWKNDGNAVTTDLLTTRIFAQRLARNGQTLLGSPKVILTNNRIWEGWLVESPYMIHHGNRYLLFFSGNSSDVEDNGIGLAVCKSPAGPCSSPYSGPWLGSNVQGAGPGEETVYTQNGITWMLYTPHSIYYPGAVPGLAAARLAFTSSDMPYVASRQGMVPGTTAGANGSVRNTS